MWVLWQYLAESAELVLLQVFGQAFEAGDKERLQDGEEFVVGNVLTTELGF